MNEEMLNKVFDNISTKCGIKKTVTLLMAPLVTGSVTFIAVWILMPDEPEK